MLNSATTTFASNASTSDLIITNGTTTAPALLTITGNYTNNGVFIAGSGTFYASSTGAQTLAGTMTGTSTFSNIEFLASGTKTFSDSASTTDVTIT